MKEQIYLYY